LVGFPDNVGCVSYSVTVIVKPSVVAPVVPVKNIVRVESVDLNWVVNEVVVVDKVFGRTIEPHTCVCVCGYVVVPYYAVVWTLD